MGELIVKWFSVCLLFTYQYFPQLKIHISLSNFLIFAEELDIFCTQSAAAATVATMWCSAKVKKQTALAKRLHPFPPISSTFINCHCIQEKTGLFGISPQMSDPTPIRKNLGFVLHFRL